MKRMKLICLALFLSLAMVLPVRAQVLDRIVAFVNNEIITLSEFSAAFEPFRLRLEETQKGTDQARIIEQARREYLDRMINDLLIEQESRKSGIVVREDEVMAAIRDMFRRRNINQEEFTKVLSRTGTSFDDYKKDVKAQLTRMKLIRREIQARVIVTQEEIGEYYQRHREYYEGAEAVRIRQILVPLPRNPDERMRKRLRAEAQSVHKRLAAGESFDVLATAYSRGDTVAGGDLGFLERGSMHREVEEAAFGLSRGEISSVIESPVGFHIIMLIDKRGAGIKPLEEVREEIRAKVEEEKMEKRFEEWLTALRKKSYIDIRL